MVTRDGARARREYGGLVLSCDEPSYAHLCALVQAEVVRLADDQEQAADHIEFISVRRAAAERERQEKKLTFWELAQIAVGVGFSGAISVVGVVTIIQWVARYFD